MEYMNSALPAITALLGVIIGTLLNFWRDSRKQKILAEQIAKEKADRWIVSRILKAFDAIIAFHFSLDGEVLYFSLMASQPELMRTYNDSYPKNADLSGCLKLLEKQLALGFSDQPEIMAAYEAVYRSWMEFHQIKHKINIDRVEAGFEMPLSNHEELKEALFAAVTEVRNYLQNLEKIIASQIPYKNTK